MDVEQTEYEEMEDQKAMDKENDQALVLFSIAFLLWGVIVWSLFFLGVISWT